MLLKSLTLMTTLSEPRSGGGMLRYHAAARIIPTDANVGLRLDFSALKNRNMISKMTYAFLRLLTSFRLTRDDTSV